MNPAYLGQREKNKLISLMSTLQDEPEESIIKEFNDICNDVLFSGKADPATFPMYR
jgi:phage terminase large subunit-like protein